MIDPDLWERIEKNPTKFLKLVAQEKIEKAAKNEEILKAYENVVANYENYIYSKDTWFAKKYPNNSIEISYFGPVIGTHLGENALALGWMEDIDK